ncbi:hypothetical protein [Microbacterium sp. NPDC089696]|uniref:hypothetical protein n=1 Tax=Microbacterium sp. NPDC089696 TaxID=3364199 RepID=UPI0037FA5698
MSDTKTELHVHALAWAVATLVVILVAERVFSGVAIATAAGAVVFGIAAVTQKRGTWAVYLIAAVAIVIGAIAAIVAASRLMAPQFF